VGDDARGAEVVLLHLGVEPLDHLGLALHLVDGVVGRERGDVAVDDALDLHRRPVAGAGGVAAGFPRHGGDLPEDRRGLGGARAERAAVDQALAAPHDREPEAVEHLCDARGALGGLLRGVEEDVRDREPRVVDDRSVEALRLEPPPPGRAGQVDQHPAAVTLAIDAPGTVDHHLQRCQGALQHLPAGLAVAGREGGQGAGIVLFEFGKSAGRRCGERRRNFHARASVSVVRRTR
jgi:hypothetical protein